MTITPISLHVLNELSKQQRMQLLARTETDLADYIAKVQPLIEAVKIEGDEALVRFAKEFDGADLSTTNIMVSEEEFQTATRNLDPNLVATLEFAAANIKAFHERQLSERRTWQMEIRPGVTVGERTMPIASVACYCPRGKGAFPSVALMTTIPAVIAGVPDIILLTPPGPDGTVDDATLVAAQLAGVTKVAKVGGAQAVAAAAFGTASVPKCRKFEGPGSPWVIAAKRVLADQLTSRLPAGPSETIVLADPTANPRLCSLDLLIEAEHGADSSAFLVTWSAEIAQVVRATLPEYMAKMGEERCAYANAVLSGNSGGIILAADAQQAYAFVNDYAPEHLQIMSQEPDKHLEHIVNAAEILLGEHTPGTLANYVMGPNCVLPTNAAAHVHSPLSVHDFLKTTTVGKVDRAAYQTMATHAHRFAIYEGFDAHANAVSDLRSNP